MMDEVVNFLVPYEVPKKVQMWPVCGQCLGVVKGFSGVSSTLILPASR